MSKRSDFYISKTELFSDLASLACRLIEKAYANASSVLVLCNDQSQAQIVDEALWAFKDTAFIPHAITNKTSSSAPIAISTSGEYARDVDSKEPVDILLYMQPELMTQEPEHQRRLILVPNDEHEVNKARQLFKALKQSKAEINHHDLRKTYI